MKTRFQFKRAAKHAVQTMVTLLAGTALATTFNVSSVDELTVALADASDGDEIVLAAGTYAYADTLYVTNGIMVRGAGARENAILKMTATNKRVVEVNHANAVLKNVTITGATISGCGGGALYLADGLVTNCVIKGNKSSGTYNGPAAATVAGGRLTGSLISENEGKHAATLAININGDSAWVDHCQVTKNYVRNNKSNGTIVLTKGRLDNCLIDNNYTDKSGWSGGSIMGVAIVGPGVMSNCTITDNKTPVSGIGGVQIASKTARIVNCIFAGNSSTTANPDWTTSNVTAADMKSICLNNITSVGALGGTDCATGTVNQIFMNFAGGDYTLAVRSPANDTGIAAWTKADGTACAIAETDLVGSPRVQGAGPDMGCYETKDEFNCSFDVVGDAVKMAGSTFSLKGAASKDGATFDWVISNVTSGVVLEPHPTGDAPAFVLSEPGWYDVELTVTKGTATAHAKKEKVLNAAQREYVVSKDGLSFADALAQTIDGCTIRVSGAVTISARQDITKAITIEGVTGHDTDKIVGDGTAHGLLLVNHAEAVVKNLTISGAKSDAAGTSAITLYDGTVTNCVLTGNKCSGHSSVAPAAYVTGGRLTGSKIHKNTGHHLTTLAVYVNSGDATLSRDKQPRVDHCEIVDNGNADNTTHGTLRLGAGIVDNCLIARNYRSGYGNNSQTAGVYVFGAGVLENCTIVGNTSVDSSAGGLYVDNNANARIVNCIIAGNTCNSTRKDWNSANTSEDFLKSVFLNDIADVNAISGTACKVATTTELFNDYAAQDYTLKAACPAFNAGTTSWTAFGGTMVISEDEVDLAGKPRISGDSVDMGCYETDAEILVADFAAIGKTEQLAGSTFCLTAVVSIASSQVTYDWKLTNGATTVTLTGRAPQFTLTEPGIYGVELTARYKSQTSVVAKEKFLTVGATDYYVSADGMTLADALEQAVAGTTIHVSGTITNTVRHDITKGVILKGASGYDVDGIIGDGKTHGLLAVNHPDAVVEDITISGGKSGSEGTSALCLYAGTVKNCVLTGNTSGGYYAEAPAAFIKGGRLTGSLITDNEGHHVTELAIQIDSGDATLPAEQQPRLDHCRIVRNRTTNNQAWGAVNLGAGIVDNCLIEGNKKTASGSGGFSAGVYVSGAGVLANCTIVGNVSLDAGAGGLYVANKAKARIVNCIVAGNSTNKDNDHDDWVCDNTSEEFLKSVFLHDVTDKNAINGTSCAVAPAAEIFTDYSAQDYSVKSLSKAFDTGVASWTAFGGTMAIGEDDVDLAAFTRISGAAVDMGCYEADASILACNFEVVGEAAQFVGSTFALTSRVSVVASDIKYEWTLTSGETEVKLSGVAPTFELTVPGYYDVALKVTVGGQTTEASLASCLRAVSREIEVASGKMTLAQAVEFAIDGCTIRVSGKNTVASQVRVQKQVTIEGADAKSDILSGNGRKNGILKIEHAGVVVRNLTITNGGSDSVAGIHILAPNALVEDCIIRDNGTDWSNSAAGIYVSADGTGTLIRRCVIRDNYCYVCPNAIGATLFAGTLENCLVTRNHGCGAPLCPGVMVGSADVSVRNCTIVNHDDKGGSKQYPDSLQAGLLISPDALESGYPEIVNTVVAGNTNAGVAVSWAVGKNKTLSTTYNTNNLVAAFSRCAFDTDSTLLPGMDVIVTNFANLGFTDDGTYQLAQDAFLRDQGVNQDWMQGTTDLYRSLPRIDHTRVDIGCTEARYYRGLIFIIR